MQQHNKILTDDDRVLHKDTIDLMYRLLPMSHAKIADAMVQEAFVYDTAVGIIPIRARILAAGAYHDVAAELLRYNGYAVYDVDPVINYDLRTFYGLGKQDQKFDCIVSTSVLEHTHDDQEFLSMCCEMLKPRGIGIFTMDFKDDWMPGQPVPYTSNRFYTQQTLGYARDLLRAHGCDLVDEPDWTAKDRFIWDGINYSFATFVFGKAST